MKLPSEIRRGDTRWKPGVAFFGLLLFVLGGAGCSRSRPPRGVLLFVFDAASADHFGCYGYQRDTTPNVDRVARRGVVLRNAFAAAPYTLSSFASLYTSHYPVSHRVLKDGDVVGDRFVTLAEFLRSRGFVTGAFADNPYLDPQFGYNQGFDVYLDYFDEHAKNAASSYPRMLEGVKRFLERARGKKFFLVVHVLPPHAPYWAPEEFRKGLLDPAYRGPVDGSGPQLESIDAGKTAIGPEDVERLVDLYDANLRFGDSLFSRVARLVSEAGRSENLDLIVTSDHGEAFGQHRRFQHNSTVYDEMIHVPLIVVPAGNRDLGLDPAALSDTVDVYPTIAAMEGLEPPAGQIQGRSLVRATGGKPFVLSYSTGLESTALRSTRFKYIRHNDEREEFYRLETDPGEAVNWMKVDPARSSRWSDLAKWEGPFMPPGQAPASENRPMRAEAMSKLLALGYSTPTGTGVQMDQPLPSEAFRASYTVSFPDSVPRGRITTLTVGVRNAGTRQWSSEGLHPVRLSSHWYDAAGKPVDFDGPRKALPGVLGPNETRQIVLPIRIPPVAGRYRLDIDLVQEDVAWFSWKGVPPANAKIDVR